jgi:DNA-binding NtrC family response regulator
MKIIGLMPNKKEEKELKRVIDDITLLNNYTDLFQNFKEENYDVLLIWAEEIRKDILLELISRALEIKEDILIYVLNDKGDMPLVAGAISAGAIDYILKPYDLN